MGKKNKVSLSIADITKQSARTGKVGPILTTFHHAPVDATSVESVSPSISLNIPSWKGDTPRIEMSLTSNSITYSGSQKQDNNSFFNTFLAIRDKETGKTQLVEYNSLVLKPQVTVPITTNPTLSQVKTEEPTLAQKVEASKHLIKSFGQQKGTRFYEQQERMKIDGAQAQDRTAKAAARVEAETLFTGPKTNPNHGKEDLLPPRNIGATIADDVYSISKILTQHELSLLKEAGAQVLTEFDSLDKLKAAQKEKHLSSMGVGLLKKILDGADQNLNQAAIVLYLEGIIKFSRLRVNELRKGVRSLQSFLPMGIRQKILDSFSNVSGSDRVISPQLEDKAKCHIIVLGLLATKLSMDVSVLSEAIWVRPDHLKKLVGLVGARLVGDVQGQGQKIELKLPLVSFNMEMMRKRKK